jgi:beta-fructofuranosidase
MPTAPSKLGPVLPLPEGYTGHVRDPKVWQHEGRWYMVLGAQDLQKRGKVLLFSSADLHEWRVRAKSPVMASTAWTTRLYVGVPGPVSARRPACPDLLPAGLPAKERYLNTYPAVWMSGDFDYRPRRLRTRRAARAGRRV